MDHIKRHHLSALVAGLVSSLALVPVLDIGWLAVPLGGLLGLGYDRLRPRAPGAVIDAAMTGAALGVPLWVGVSIVGWPLLTGATPLWHAAAMRALLPALVGWVAYGGVLGGLVVALDALLARRWGTEASRPLAPPPAPTRIVIVGGGFAGVTTARELERRAGPEPGIAITLISETNALLFTPMLAEVAGGSLEPTHISTPLRTSLRRTTVMRRRVTAIDLAGRRVLLAPQPAAAPTTVPPTEATEAVAFDHLVLAVGSVSNFLGLTGVQQTAFDFKSLGDAIRIRNHLIDVIERAATETDPIARQTLLTVVVVGGGFAGVELVGALNDFARGMLALYPTIAPTELTIMLVHSRATILPELSEGLGAYALERLRARGVTFKLNERLVDAQPGQIMLSSSEPIRTATLVWTAGVTPNPLLKTLGIALDRRGALPVDPYLAVPDCPGLWALGDCAAVVDGQTGRPAPPTAQFALRQARTLAANLWASHQGRPGQRFHFDALGILAVIGHQTACAELALPPGSGRAVRFSGLLAWLMWRTVYLSKLPGLERKVRVLSDWTIELFFPRDIVQTLDSTPGSVPTDHPPVAANAAPTGGRS